MRKKGPSPARAEHTVKRQRLSRQAITYGAATCAMANDLVTCGIAMARVQLGV